MPNFKPYNQNQSMLLPPDIRDWLSKDHICFVINDVVDKLDLTYIENTYSNARGGCPAFNPRMLIKLIFYSYTQGIRSSRKIEKMANENIVFRYLSANQQIDHGTVSLFRKTHLTDLENLFVQIVILCDGLNIINPMDISIDGTIIKANASRKQTLDYSHINGVKEKIRDILRQAQAIDDAEDKIFGKNRRGYNQMPDKLLDPKTRQKEIERLQKKMNKLENTEKIIKAKQLQAKTKEEKELSKNTTHNTTDSDANLMKMKSGKTYKPAYNVQIATSNQVITAYDVTDNGNDNHQLLSMIEKAENNLNKKVETVKADAGYFSKNNIEKIQEKQIDSYIPDPNKSREEKQQREKSIPEFDRRNFKYNQNKDQLICPQKQSLNLFKTDKGVKKYICSNCSNCSVKTKCIQGKNRHVQIDWQLEEYKTEMRKKLNSKIGKNKYLERMSEVEPCFGNIIYNQNAGHFLCRGKPMVKIEFGLTCIAHNLVKIANWIKTNKTNKEKIVKIQQIHFQTQQIIQLDTLIRLPVTIAMPQLCPALIER